MVSIAVLQAGGVLPIAAVEARRNCSVSQTGRQEDNLYYGSCDRDTV